MSEPETREQRAAIIQANLAKPQTNHHPSCCCGCRPPQGKAS